MRHITLASVVLELVLVLGCASQPVPVPPVPDPPPNITRLRITTTSLPAAVLGRSYMALLQATGGVPPYKWRIFSGKLPTGLVMNTGGLITGKPILCNLPPCKTIVTFQVEDTEGGRATLEVK